MKLISHFSLRHKMIFISMLITVSALLLASIAFITTERLYAHKNVIDGLETTASMIASTIPASLLFNDTEAANETLNLLALQQGIQVGMIYLDDGTEFSSYRRKEFQGKLPGPGNYEQSVNFNDQYSEIFMPIKHRDKLLGLVYLRSDMEMVHDHLKWYLGVVAIVMSAALLLAYILSSQLQRFIVNPLLKLSAIARRVSSEQNFTLRVTEHGRDELGNLICDFNNMLDEIQQRDNQLKSYQEELEERVILRTRELEIVNDRLEASKEEAEDVARRMEYHAHHDSLTGLPNRNLLNDRIRKELIKAKREQDMIALLFLDLDRFKVINDTLGHTVGDQLLKNISRRLKSCLREGDTVARLGGDEFMVLLPGISSPEDAGRIATKIIKSLTKPLACSGRMLHITTSIGISVYPYDGTDEVTLVKHADVSMYHAKELGRNKMVYFSAEMNEASRKRLALESSLSTALENNQFYIVYQPKVDVSINSIVGVEALLRWEHPTLGTVSPLDFIPIAEESGLIIPIGEWILHQTFNQLRQWHDAGFADLTMAVNLSAAQLSRPGIEKIIENALGESGISADKVELEVTENVAMRNIDYSIIALEKLKARGMKIAMDDFGTGYSSLGYLRKLPIDTVKIDRSFVSEIPDSNEDVLIAQAIIAMAQSLNLSLVVEGVENVRQLNFFEQQGCHIVQGYLFSKPVSAEEILAKLNNQKFPGTVSLAGS